MLHFDDSKLSSVTKESWENKILENDTKKYKNYKTGINDINFYV